MKLQKIAHFIATNFYGGPERQIIHHALSLTCQETGYNPIIVSFIEDGQQNELLAKADSCKIQNASIRATGTVNFKAITELINILRQFEVNILITHGFKANVIGRLASMWLGIPMIAVSRGWTAENWKIRLYERADKLFLRWATHVVAVSEGQRQKILKLGVRPENVSTIHNAIDLHLIPPASDYSIRDQLHIPDNAIFVCTAGRLSPEKDQASLVEAARILCHKRPDIYFCIFGEGACRPFLEEKINQYNLQERFFLPGFKEDLLALLHEIDIFTLPSLTEGLPNVILEAFAWRKPVVATRVGGTPEVVQHGYNGFLHAPQDVSALIEYLLELANDPEKRLTMGENGYRYVSDHFTYNKQTERYLKLYNGVGRHGDR